MAEAAGTDQVFCGECGARIRTTARFCTSCGASQEQFAESVSAGVREPEPVDFRPPAPPAAPHDAALVAENAQPENLAAAIEGEELRRALIDRHGFRETFAASAVKLTEERGQPRFRPEGRGVIAELANLLVRVDAGELVTDNSACACVAVTFGEDALRADEDALAEIANRFGVSGRSDRGVTIYARLPEYASPLTLVGEVAEAVATAARIEESMRPDVGSRPFSIEEFPVWVTSPDASAIDGLELEHVEIATSEATCESLEVAIGPAGGDSIGQQARDLHGILAPRTLRANERVIATMIGDGVGLEAADGTALAFGSGACMLTDQRLVGVVSARPEDDAIGALDLKAHLKSNGITFLDAEDRELDPFDFWTEKDKRSFFLDQAGWIADDGTGVALVFSARGELFERSEIEGGRVAFRLGNPVIRLLGPKLSFSFRLYWVLDKELRMVTPQRDVIRGAIDGLTGGPASQCGQCGSTLEPGSRFCSNCGAELSGS